MLQLNQSSQLWTSMRRGSKRVLSKRRPFDCCLNVNMNNGYVNIFSHSSAVHVYTVGAESLNMSYVCAATRNIITIIIIINAVSSRLQCGHIWVTKLWEQTRHMWSFSFRFLTSLNARTHTDTHTHTHMNTSVCLFLMCIQFFCVRLMLLLFYFNLNLQTLSIDDMVEICWSNYKVCIVNKVLCTMLCTLIQQGRSVAGAEAVADDVMCVCVQ